jgi:Site-specific DNA methylase
MRSKYVDQRNLLILEYYRAVKAIEPEFIMLENVPEIVHFEKFKSVLKSLKKLGYNLDSKIINVKDFGVPQNRKRLVLLGSKHYEMNFPTCNDSCYLTVRDAIGNLKTPSISDDPMQKVYSHHTERIKKMISLIPKNGGSRRDLPYEYWLECHKKRILDIPMYMGECLGIHRHQLLQEGACLLPKEDFYILNKIEVSVYVRLRYYNHFL